MASPEKRQLHLHVMNDYHPRHEDPAPPRRAGSLRATARHAGRGGNRTKRLIKSSKLYWGDTGVAQHLSGDDEPRGALLENLVLGDHLLGAEGSALVAPQGERAAAHDRQVVDDAMAAIERDNASLKGVLPKDYARPGLDKERLGQLVNLVSDIALGDPAERAGFARAAPGGARSVDPELSFSRWSN